MSYKVKIVFGEVPARDLEESSNPERLFEEMYLERNIDGSIRDHDFDTKEEMDAYLLGVYESSGWFDYSILEGRGTTNRIR